MKKKNILDKLEKIEKKIETLEKSKIKILVI